MSHCLRLASEVITNAPLCVPTSTRTPLMPLSFLKPACELYENTGRRLLCRDLLFLDRGLNRGRPFGPQHSRRNQERDEGEPGADRPGKMVAAAQRGRHALAVAEQIAGATRRQRGQHGEPERTGDL